MLVHLYLLTSDMNKKKIFVEGHKPSTLNDTSPLQEKVLQLYYNRPYSEQHHDMYECEAVRDRLTVYPMASAVKS